MRILITGAAGFLGGHLAERFLREGYEVVGLDNYVTGSQANIELLSAYDGFEFVEHDISKPIVFAGPLGGILHFASPASPVDYLELPIQTLKVGSLGTHHTLGIAKAKGARFLLASTSEVYGDPQVHPQTEEYWGHVNPVGLRGVYDEAKRFAEAMTMAYHRHHGIDTRIVRIFNTYGPRMRPGDGRVVSNFIVQALRGEPLTIYGDGSQTRSFTYVEDEVDGIFRLFNSDRVDPTNVGNPHEFTIRELADVVREEVGSDSTLDQRPLPEDDPKVRQPDITVARDVLGWEPTIELREGIRRTVPYFRNLVDSEDARSRSSVSMARDRELIKRDVATGNSAWEREEYEHALQTFEGILADHPDFADVHNKAGLCLAMLDRAAEALEHFDAALEINSSYAEAHLNRAIVLNELGRHEEATAAFSVAGELDTRDSRAFPSELGNRLAVTHAQLGDMYLVADLPDEAVKHYQAALSVRPRFVDIRSKYAESLILVGRLRQAREELEGIMEERPEFLGARIRLGVVLKRLGDADGAAREWRLCAEQALSDMRPRAYLASLGHEAPGSDVEQKT